MEIQRNSLVLAVLLIVVTGILAAPVSAAPHAPDRHAAIMEFVNTTDPANATLILEALKKIDNYSRISPPAIPAAPAPVPASIDSVPESTVSAVIGPTDSIQAAIDATPDGGTVYLNPGTYHEHDITIAKNIRIQANPSAGGSRSNTIIDAQDLGRIFDVIGPYTVSIDNLALQNGMVTDTGTDPAMGGAILAGPGSSLTITSTSFSGCLATGEAAFGGAIFSEGNTLSIISSVFTGCSATATAADSAIAVGGAIFSPSEITSVTSSTFTGCSAEATGTNAAIAEGGAITSTSETTSITASTFTGCSATASAANFAIVEGGTILSASETTLVTSSTFTGCSGAASAGILAESVAGAIVSEGATTIVSTTFSGCSATAITSNMAAVEGGAVYSGTLPASITSSTFTGCSASVSPTAARAVDGGGAVWSVSEPLSITSSTFTGCSAMDGGAVHIEFGPATIHFSRFYQNSASGAGPAVDALEPTDATNNWWGTNSNPASQVYGPVTTDPWLVLGIFSEPLAISSASTAGIHASLRSDSAGANTSLMGHVPDAVPCTFGVTDGSGSVSPGAAGTANGLVLTTFTPDREGSCNISATIDGQTVYLDLPVLAIPVVTLDTSGFDDGFPSATIVPSPTGEGSLPLMTVTVNIGGDSKAWQAMVTGTKLSGLIVTGTVQPGAGSNLSAPPGIVYQYIDLVPARYMSITKAVINFTVPQSWLDENHIAPGSIVLYHQSANEWEALPTTVLYTRDGTASFSGQSPGFSLFAIAGMPAGATPVVTAATPPGIVSTVGETPVPAAAREAPSPAQTTVPPADPPAPAGTSPFPVLPALIVAGCVVLAGSGVVARRWWVRRQNPALFEESG